MLSATVRLGCRDEGFLDYARNDSVEGWVYSKESLDDCNEEGRIVAVSIEMAVLVLRRIEFGIVSTKMTVLVLMKVRYSLPST